MVTIQSGAQQFNGNNIKKYSLFLGGMDTRHDALLQYDIQSRGFYRLFMVREPMNVAKYLAGKDGKGMKFQAFKHILEYGNCGVSGLQSPTVKFGEVQGGFNGKKIQIPVGTEDGTDEFTIKCVDFSGSIMREVIHTWVNMGNDLDSGYTHFNGMIASGELPFSQAYQSAEFIYVITDRTGMQVQYAAHLTNCYPKDIPTEQFNADDPADHDIVSFDLKFACNKREGYDVNKKAAILLKNCQICVNSLEYCTGLTDANLYGNEKTGYNPETGLLENRDNIDYRTKLTNKNTQQTAAQPLDTDTLLAATPSFTDIGNRAAK